MSTVPNQVMLDKTAMLEALITDRTGWPKRRSDCYGSCDRHYFVRLAVVAMRFNTMTECLRRG